MAGPDAHPPRLIAIFGSGETSPVMTSVHQNLIARVSDPRLNAILLDTPFGFQPNADEIAARTIAYFRQHVGSDISLASFRHSGQATTDELEAFLTRLDQANYVFAGPGSPTYALRHWRDNGVRDRLREKVVRGGCVAFASAAAIGLGTYALPVYEIYKVGDDPSWTQGLDLLSEIGIRCALIPHYNNHEGGTHDTRYCYMGESRLRLLESMLPDGSLILGIDEYTACIIDVEAQSVTVRGRGGVTVRRRGMERLWKRTTFPLRELQEPVDAVAPGGIRLRPAIELAPAPTPPKADALGRRGVDGVVTAILQMEGVLDEDVADIAGTQGRDRVRAEMHDLRGRLPGLSGNPGEVRQSMAPLVDVVLSLRGEARREHRFGDADRLREILMQCGVEVQDTPTGTAWSLAQT